MDDDTDWLPCVILSTTPEVWVLGVRQSQQVENTEPECTMLTIDERQSTFAAANPSHIDSHDWIGVTAETVIWTGAHAHCNSRAWTTLGELTDQRRHAALSHPQKATLRGLVDQPQNCGRAVKGPCSLSL